MTTTTYAPESTATRDPAERAPADRGVTLTRTVHAEWIKLSTLRSSWAMLAAAGAGMLAIALVVAYNTGRHHTGLDPEDAVLSATLQGYHLADLLMGILGVLFVSGEYATGMIRSTLAAVPKRVPVLLAKAAVLGAVVLVTMTLATVVSFLSSQALLGHYHHGFSLSDPTGVRVVFGTAVYLTLVALLGSAFGWIVRSTPGGISSLVGFQLVLPVLLGLFGTFGRDVVQYLPGAAGESFAVTLHAAHTLSPGVGLAVQVAWVLGAMGVAAVLLRRRDA